MKLTKKKVIIGVVVILFIIGSIQILLEPEKYMNDGAEPSPAPTVEITQGAEPEVRAEEPVETQDTPATTPEEPTEMETISPESTETPAPIVTLTSEPMPTPEEEIAQTPEPTLAPVIDPEPIPEPTPETPKITGSSSYVFNRNENATISAKGAPNTEYKISVYYNSGASTAAGLEKKTSDANGNVSWTWKIGGSTNFGTYSATITGGGDTFDIVFEVVE